MTGIMPVQRHQRFPILSTDDRKRRLDRLDPACSFHLVVGQVGAVDALTDVLHRAYQDELRRTPYPAILFHGGRSNGKTMMARLTAQALERKFVEADGNLIRSTDDIFELGIGAGNDMRCPVIEIGTRNGVPLYQFPNFVFFIDEIHSLKSNLVNGLLKPLEAKDMIMTIKDGYVDVSNVLWIGATTERGDMFPPLESRFYKIAMLDYNLEEMAEIVKINFSQWSLDDCREVAKRSGMIAREALALAQAVQLNSERWNCSVVEALQNVSVQRGIDEYGTTKQQVWVMEALSKKPQGLNYDQLCRVAQCNVDELKRYVLPPLLVHTEAMPAKVVWTGQRSCLTEAGIADLKKRNIAIDETLFFDKNGT